MTRPILETHDEGTSFRPGWYGELELQPIPRLRVIPGARFDYARDSGHADFSPRLNARYDLIAGASSEEQAAGISRRRTTLKGGAGLFHQPPEFQETDPVFGTPGLLSPRAVHYSVGVEQEITQQIDLSVEGSYKDLTRQVSRAPAAAGFNYSNDGTGRAYGLETMLKYKADERFFGWLATPCSRGDPEGSGRGPIASSTTTRPTTWSCSATPAGAGLGVRRVASANSGRLMAPALPAPALTALYAADAGSYVIARGRSGEPPLPVRAPARYSHRQEQLAVSELAARRLPST